MTETIESTTAASGASANAPKKRGGGLNSMLIADLKSMAGGMGIAGAGSMKKAQLVEAIKSAQSGSGRGGPAKGGPATGDSGRETPAKETPAQGGQGPGGPDHGVPGQGRLREGSLRQGRRPCRRDAGAPDLRRAGPGWADSVGTRLR